MTSKDEPLMVLAADDAFDPAQVDVGVRLIQQANEQIAAALAEMLAGGRDPRRHCVVVGRVAPPPDAPPLPEGQEWYAVFELPRAEVARSFAAAGRADIAQGITSHRTAPGCGLVVVTWAGGTQLHQHELAAPSKGGRA
ncbi:MAG: hypothetical protein U0324_44330 [Polyangiales bacterium]